jgi:hypothetical protein
MVSSKTKKPTKSRNLRVRKCIARPETKPERFRYINTKGKEAVARYQSTLFPTQQNHYTFNPAQFAKEPKPVTLPEDAPWPPQTVTDLVTAMGKAASSCVGNTCYTTNVCNKPDCTHTLENWIKSTSNWKAHFELRQSPNKGVGVYAKHFFRRGTILGWYTGELIPLKHGILSDYLMELAIGHVYFPSSISSTSSDLASYYYDQYSKCETTIFVDAEKKGNWTRFINHACDAHAVFQIWRVGAVRIMVVVAQRDVRRGEELTVSYGEGYYGIDTAKVCGCGGESCVSLRRRDKMVLRERKGRE